ncbi:MBL fold metallo-hydrolase [Clostridium sp. OS1-26]|uniref:MBL fold metallo-hydrolase n=1 Tax=Clostridium sp. OS1-26 TaxID=3070681 RepID=UPI0027E111CE|nr:MBL fold metallo-hydrolase [Clostridium sp. OS1-26]WML34953.1 MBL fold metallo-hydrolase [Clostridium sp. OS1-26]
MKIADGVEMLEVSSNVMGSRRIINPTLIYDKGIVILVDTGYPGQLPQIRQAIEDAGVSFDKLNRVILTHHDIDHIGSLSSIVKELPNSVKALAHKEEEAYINGIKTPIKLAQLEANFSSLSDDMKIIYEKLKAGFEGCKADVNQTLIDGEELPYCGGIEVIHTPGHTLGHICLYLKQLKILIAGDILAVEDGMLVKAPDFINFDADLNIKSLKKLTEYDIETVICYHGELYNNNTNKCIAELTKNK